MDKMMDDILKPLNAYACLNIDRDVRLNSSSGAVFSALAEYVLEQNGVVYGVAMSEDCYSAEYISVTRKEDLSRLRGSKYLQAKVGDAYKYVKNDLLSDRFVLFSGTGCQVNGLKSFLGKEYDNLICVDVICHGTPSPALWRAYVKNQEKKNGGKVESVSFRCKDDGWTDFGMKEVCVRGPEGKTNERYIPKEKDSYMQMFLRNYCLRPSCYECTAKKIKMSDLTIADFWGINDVAPEMNDGMGTSLVIVRTGKGKTVFDKIGACLKLKEVSYEDAVRGNPAEYKSCRRPSQRNSFFDDMNGMDYEKLEKKYVGQIKFSLVARLKRKAKCAFIKLCKPKGK